MSLLPAAAQLYVPAPLQALMAPGHPLSELYHASPPPVWRAELASRIRLAVEALPVEAYSAEERQAIAVGNVRVFGLMHESGHLAAEVAHLAADRRLAPLRAPPPPPVGGAPLRTPERVGVASVPSAFSVNEEANGVLRWRWGDGAPPAVAPLAVAAPAAAVLPPAPPPPPPTGAPPPAADMGRHLLALLQQPAPPQQPAAPAPQMNAGAALLALLQPQAQPPAQPQAQPQAQSPPPAPLRSVLPPSGLLSRQAPSMAPSMAPSEAPSEVTTAAQLELEQLLDLLRPPSTSSL